MINYDNVKGTGADSGLVFAEMAKEARNVSKTVCSNLVISKVGCVFPMVSASILHQAEFGRNEYRENASHFRLKFD